MQTARMSKFTLALGVILLSACGGGGGNSSTPIIPPILQPESFELLDPSPGIANGYGSRVLILGNGNIVVSDAGDSSIAPDNGAVHLYDSIAQTLISSIYGDQAGDFLGERVTALGNNNYVIASRFDDNGAIVDAGSVMLVDGSTGVPIGTPLEGDQANDSLGGSIIPLDNNNFVIISPLDDSGAIVDAGSIILVNGNTGTTIGTPWRGDQVGDGISTGVRGLGNNNYVISAVQDDDGATVDAGSVRLVNGSTGETIGTPILGDQAGDSLGSSRVTVLGNNNYVISSPLDDDGTIVDAGSVRLVNGSTGETIGAPLIGDQANDMLGDLLLVTEIGNNNYVIASSKDDDGATVDAGSVRLVNGSTGVPIGTPLVGDQTGDLEIIAITALGNNNYVVTTTLDDDGATVNAGSVRLVDGNSGAVIGTPLVGDQTDDLLGNIGSTALGNNNYVVASGADDDGTTVNAGSVRLVNGSTGETIGTPLVGGQFNDRFGQRGITALDNNNYVVASNNEGPVVTAQRGSVRLVDGDTGLPIGEPLIGDQDNDELGFGGVTALNDNHYVVVSIRDDDGATVDAGSVRVINGDTGVEIDNVIGTTTDDLVNAQITVPAIGNYFVLSAPNWDNNGQQNSGLVRLIAP